MENVSLRQIVDKQGLQKKNKEGGELCSIGIISSEAKSFLQFDVFTDYSDHMFADSEMSIIARSSAHKEIMKEWKILNENLPTSIYVRIYENRIDLLTAVIVGVPGTPYHDGLFFFDIMFTDCYPDTCPSVRLRSYGLKLNSSISPEGKICSSLLRRTSGGGYSEWMPGKSTIFQLLISLQALVLKEEPSYHIDEIQSKPDRNKPIDTWSADEKWTMRVKNRVFEVSCELMVSCLRNPPKNFEEFVTRHFFERSRFILSACVAYMNGFERVGGYRDHGSFLKEEVPVIASLKCSMETAYRDLCVAFTKIDTSLGEYIVQLHQMAKVKNRLLKNKKEPSGVRKLFKMFKSIIFVGKNVNNAVV